MANVVITGATGFLGSHLTRAFLDAGHRVRGLVRTPSKGAWLRELGAELVKGDLLDPASLVEGFRGSDTLIANAALGSNQGDLEAFERVNMDGARHTLEAAVEAGVKRVVWISTVAVYRTQVWRRMDEQATRYDVEKRRFNWSDLTTDWRYARTKTRAEDLAWAFAEEHGLELTVLRPGPIYGSRDVKLTQRYLDGMSQRIALAPWVGVPQVHAGDVALAAVSSLGKPASVGQAYNIAGPPTSPWAVAKTLRRLLESNTWLVPVPVPVAVRYDTSAAFRDLGFVARSLEDGLREVVDSLEG